MRHRKKKITLGREAGPRRALLRSLVESMILHGSVTTTRARAKAIRVLVEPLVTKAKTDALAPRRQLKAALSTDQAVNMLLKDIAPRYKDRAGGYTRTTKLDRRGTDSAEMVKIEFV